MDRTGHGKIYGIVSARVNGLMYVGSTFQPLDVRFKQHLSTPTPGSKVIINLGECTISLLVDLGTTTRREMERIEFGHMKKYVCSNIANYKPNDRQKRDELVNAAILIASGLKNDVPVNKLDLIYHKVNAKHLAHEAMQIYNAPKIRAKKLALEVCQFIDQREHLKARAYGTFNPTRIKINLDDAYAQVIDDWENSLLVIENKHDPITLDEPMTDNEYKVFLSRVRAFIEDRINTLYSICPKSAYWNKPTRFGRLDDFTHRHMIFQECKPRLILLIKNNLYMPMRDIYIKAMVNTNRRDFKGDVTLMRMAKCKKCKRPSVRCRYH